MPIPAQQAQALITALRTPQIARLFAQAHARHVLYEVNEDPANFPAFDPELDGKVTFSAYALLAAGCSLIEQGNRPAGADALERAASLLHYVHGPNAQVSRHSNFHALVASMSFYAAGQYSRAFVSIRDVESYTAAGRTIAAFLRRSTSAALEHIKSVLLQQAPEPTDEVELDEAAITSAIVRSISLAIEFGFAGNSDLLGQADECLRDASVVASIGMHPAWWWIIRLLRLMLKDLQSYSPWTVLPPFFDPSNNSDLSKYIRLLAFGAPPVTEIWTSQREALDLVLDVQNRGAVVNLRTSAGKTRVAELAIFQTLLSDATARVFYIAPFRSLAIEIEQVLARSFSWLGFNVSHLYGDARVSAIDAELAAESSILIATPEKARALFRASPELFANVRLIVIDEGHTIGSSERDTRNELFTDHLRCIARASGARILLLSAVLPNACDLAEWVACDSNAVAKSPWKPSAERFGLLRWDGSRVKIIWQGEVESFNPSFVEAETIGSGRRKKVFPRDKNGAVATAAVRLSAVGPVMIFVGKALSVPTMAKEVLTALGETPAQHPWPRHEWSVFEAVCSEELDAGAIELIAARAGVICHSNRLTTQVRLAMEHLMRAVPPKIIIATTTLAQGVNVGISCVIISSPYIDREPIDKRQFWNICGRAGRAFVDHEGKILYAIDDTRERWQIKKDEKLARDYFDRQNDDDVQSGLLFALYELRKFAQKAGVSFALLLEMAANNDFSALREAEDEAMDLCDRFDDGLLAMHMDPIVNTSDSDSTEWVEDAFRSSLAAIQGRAAGREDDVSDLLNLFRARTVSGVRRVADRATRKAIVSSALPLSIATRSHADLDLFMDLADEFIDGGEDPSALADVVCKVEEWARSFATSVVRKVPEKATLDLLRPRWLSGVGLRELSGLVEDAQFICKDLYAYHLPWIMSSVSHQVRSAGDVFRADVLAKIALLTELGVPDELAARVFLAGVRSRAASTELSALAELSMVDIKHDSSVAEIGRKLRDGNRTRRILPLVSPSAAAWLELLVASAVRPRGSVVDFPQFTWDGVVGFETLHVRKVGGSIFLCGDDGRPAQEVSPDPDLPFERVADDPRIAFVRSESNWIMAIRDPRVTVEPSPDTSS